MCRLSYEESALRARLTDRLPGTGAADSSGCPGRRTSVGCPGLRWTSHSASRLAAGRRQATHCDTRLDEPLPGPSVRTIRKHTRAGCARKPEPGARHPVGCMAGIPFRESLRRVEEKSPPASATMWPAARSIGIREREPAAPPVLALARSGRRSHEGVRAPHAHFPHNPERPLRRAVRSVRSNPC